MSAPPPTLRPARPEYLALLTIAATLTAVWLDLWVEWTRRAWLSGDSMPGLWPVGLVLAGLVAGSLTELALRPGLAQGLAIGGRRTARGMLAGAGALSVFLLGAWAMGLPAL